MAHLPLVKEIPHGSSILISSVKNRNRPQILKPCCRPASTLHCASTPWKALRVVAFAAALIPLAAQSQLAVSSNVAPGNEAIVTIAHPDLIYTRPTERTKVENYLFDAYGPYPVAGAAVTAGINQFTNSAPEWGQGAQGYGKRVGSDFGIAAVATTTRYGLSQAFRQDALYYRCDCRGFVPRVNHALISTFTARRDIDGHRVFSLPALVAPYAGTFTAVYGWYPDRYGAKDAFRMGNYSLLAYAAGNLSLEFFYSGPHSLLSRMHLNNPHGALAQGPNP